MSKKKKCNHTFNYKGPPTSIRDEKFLVKECTKCGTKKYEKVKENERKN